MFQSDVAVNKLKSKVWLVIYEIKNINNEITKMSQIKIETLETMLSEL